MAGVAVPPATDSSYACPPGIRRQGGVALVWPEGESSPLVRGFAEVVRELAAAQRGWRRQWRAG